MKADSASASPAKATRIWSWIAAPVVLICIVVSLATVRERYYVATMYGPYRGLEYSGGLPSTSISELRLKSGGRLAVYTLPEALAPVLVLWSATGERRWARTMLPVQRYTDGTEKEAWLKELKLHQLRRSGDGFVVDLSCDWELGGREGGRLYLDSDYNFREFKLSW